MATTANRRPSDRLSTISTVGTNSPIDPDDSDMAASPTPTAMTQASSLNSLSSSRHSLNSSNSVSTIGESIAHEQRPRLITPALKTPTWPSGNGVLSMVCATTIRAPLPLVVGLLLDARTYPSWNKFCPGVTVTNQPKSTAPLPPCLAHDDHLNSIANSNNTLRDGTTFIMDVLMEKSMDANPRTSNNRKTTPTLQVSRLEQFERDGRIGVRLAWRIKGKVANLLVRSERVQEFMPVMNAPGPAGVPCVEYVCWETYYGLLAGSMKAYWGKQLEVGYAAWMDGLKRCAEEKAEAAGLA